MKKKYDIASLTMCLLYFLTLFGNSFAIVMENRVSPMSNISALKALENWYWLLILFVLILAFLIVYKGENPRANLLAGVFSAFGLGLTFFAIGLAANQLMMEQASSYRVTFGTNFYVQIFALYAIIVKCNEKVAHQYLEKIPVFIALASISLLFGSGWMNNLSIMIEYFTRQAKFYETLSDHLEMSFAVIISSVIVGIILGFLCYRTNRVNRIIMGFLNVVRSVPSIALITIMVPILSLFKKIPLFENLGFSSFGATPLFIALFLYSLFIIIINLVSGLKTINPEYIKTARAMGMSEMMIMYRIQLPMIMPVLIAGIRIAMISTFTAVSLGTMVGFGGLGTFITMGGGSAVALDLILLGAIPIMIMIFIADSLLSWLEKFMAMKIYGITAIKN